MTLADVRALIEEAALGADAIVEAVLPSFAQAYDWDDCTRVVVGIESEFGYGSERSRVIVFADPIDAPCTELLDAGRLLAHVAHPRLGDSTPIVVSIEGEPDDRVEGEWPVIELGAVRRFGNDLVPSLMLRLE